nr:immunoglobulin light chain junction region [Homo sapiens]MCD08915.1 immunoglobulin light chain junction region [Homo sapiens]
CQQYYSTPP